MYMHNKNMTAGELSRYKFISVNGELRPFDPMRFKDYCKWMEGIPVYVDDYGGGAVYWTLISSPENHEIELEKVWKVWAASRFPWALSESPREVEELLEVMRTGKRYPGRLNTYIDPLFR